MSQPEWALTQVEKNKKKYIESLTNIFDRRKDEFQAALRDTMNPEFFRRLVVTAATRSPTLMDCTHASLYQAALEIAQLQLEPNTELGEAYLIPYRNGRSGVTECQVQIGRNGWIKLAKRTGIVKGAPNALPVYRGEKFVWQPGNTPEVLHQPSIEVEDKAEIVAAYAWIDFTDGSRAYEVLRKKDITRIKKAASRGGKLSPAWREFEDRMVCRSALKRLIKSRLPVNEFLAGKESIESDPDAIIIDTEAVAVVTEGAATYSIDTGEILSVSPSPAEPDQPDGVVGAEHDDGEEHITEMSVAQFWKFVQQKNLFWGVSFTKDDVLDLLGKVHGADKGKGGLSKLSKQERASFAVSVESEMSAASKGGSGESQ